MDSTIVPRPAQSTPGSASRFVLKVDIFKSLMYNRNDTQLSAGDSAD